METNLSQQNQIQAILTEYNKLDIWEQLALARWYYSIGHSIIDDATYTNLYNACKAQDPTNAYITRSWSSDPCPKELLKKIGREVDIQAVVLQAKTESIESLNTWLDIEKSLGGWQGSGTVSYKHDGWNIQASYYNGDLALVQTRGRSTNAMKVECVSKLLPQHITLEGRVKVVFELTIDNSMWGIVKHKYGTTDQRASVSTLLANEDTQYMSYHAFDIHGTPVVSSQKFSLLQELGFKTPEYIVVHNYQEIKEAVEQLSFDLDRYDSPTDGVVFDGGFKYALRVESWEEPSLRDNPANPHSPYQEGDGDARVYQYHKP